jgi:hypothetical protein
VENTAGAIPASLLGVPFHSGGSVLRGPQRIALAILLRLGAYFHQLASSFIDAEASVERRHAPGKVRAAYIRAGIAVIGWGGLQAAVRVERISAMVGRWSLGQLVEALRGLRGIDMISAAPFIASTGDLSRF